MVKSIVPAGRGASLVVLRGGEELELEETADAGDGNDGILVFKDGREQVYIPWDEVRRLDFD